MNKREYTTTEPKLYVLCGIPGSGKSYFAQQMSDINNTLWVSRDEIRYKALGGEDKVTLRNYFSKENQVKEQFFETINMCLKYGYNTIADATHLHPAARKELLKRIYADHKETIAVVFTTPYPVCKERNHTRTGIRVVPDDQLARMWRSFQYPLLDEGFTHIYEVDEEGKVHPKY